MKTKDKNTLKLIKDKYTASGELVVKLNNGRWYSTIRNQGITCLWYNTLMIPLHYIPKDKYHYTVYEGI